ncbi:MAG: DUF2207 domain-containing protein, partial [Bacillota bacterium]
MKQKSDTLTNNLKLRIIVVFLAFIAVTLLSPAGAGADDRSFYFPEVVIEAEIKPDGSMEVVEDRTFSFDGHYQGAWQYIYLKHNAEIRDVRVSESGQPYEEMPIGTQDVPDIFYVDYKQDHVYIDWSFEAQDENRTFTISYTVDKVVLVHQDVAELYWQFIGDEWGERTSYAKVTLTLPEGATQEQIRAWGHGPLQGDVTVVSPTTVTWEVENLPARTFLEGRVAFPPELVPQSSNFSGKEGLPGILEDEEQWAREANLQRMKGRIDYILGPLLAIGMLIYLIVISRKAKRSRDAYKGDYYRELPGDYTPAEAGYLVRFKRNTPEDFTATLMDLARRGHLKLEEYEGEKGWLFKREYTGYRIIPAE